MKFLTLLALICLAVVPIRVLSQYRHSSDTLLDHMTGKWQLKGNIAGKNVEHVVIVQWILGHQYVELKETSNEKLADGKPAYDAIVIISKDSLRQQYDCLWLDNTSNKGISNGIVAYAKIEPNQIAFLFKINNDNYFHTTFIYSNADDSWHWIMVDDEKGKTNVFANAIMMKSL